MFLVFWGDGMDNKIKTSAIVRSGASTGAFEAHELRDNDKNYFLGKSVLKAVKNVNSIISKNIINLDPNDQKKIDDLLLKLDGSENKKKFRSQLVVSSFSRCKKSSHHIEQ